MIDPASGPYLFDTSAESYFGQPRLTAEKDWLDSYSRFSPMYISVLTVVERTRGYLMAEHQADTLRKIHLKRILHEYLATVQPDRRRVLDVTTPTALAAAHLMVLCPRPPSPARPSHRLAESRADRLSRWRFDIMIAATALIHNLPLIHNNPQDFESLRTLIEQMPERFPGVGPLNLISVKRLAA